MDAIVFDGHTKTVSITVFPEDMRQILMSINTAQQSSATVHKLRFIYRPVILYHMPGIPRMKRTPPEAVSDSYLSKLSNRCSYRSPYNKSSIEFRFFRDNTGELLFRLYVSSTQFSMIPSVSAKTSLFAESIRKSLVCQSEGGKK